MLCLAAILAAPVGRALLPQVGNPPESGCEAWIEGRRCRAGSMPERFIVADSAACLVKCAGVGEDGCCLYDNGRCKFYAGKHVLNIEGDAPGRSAAQCHDDGSDTL